jgi:hypothetical protein
LRQRRSGNANHRDENSQSKLLHVLPPIPDIDSSFGRFSKKKHGTSFESRMREIEAEAGAENYSFPLHALASFTVQV